MAKTFNQKLALLKLQLLLENYNFFTTKITVFNETSQAPCKYISVWKVIPLFVPEEKERLCLLSLFIGGEVNNRH